MAIQKRRCISILNFKGGVSKTTTAVNLAHALSQGGANVVLVDCDRQRNATSILPPTIEIKNTLLEVLIGQVPMIDALYEARPGLYILPAHGNLANAAKHLTMDGSPFAYKILRRGIENLDGVDYVLFDHPPSVSTITDAVLLASEEVLIPVEMEAYSVMGVVDMIDKLQNEIMPKWEHQVKLTGLVPCNLDYTKKMTTEYLEALKKQFGPLVLPIIRTDAQVSKSQSVAQTIFEYNPKSKAAEDYLALAQAIVQPQAEEARA